MLSGTSKTLLAVAIGAAALIGASAGAVTVAVVGDSGTTKTVTKTVDEVVPATATTTADSSSLSVNQIYRQASPAVVELTVTSQASVGPFGDTQEQQAQGSGFVYDGQGHIVTDEHVVAGAQSISVRFSSGATYSARVVGSDSSTDLAVIKVNAPQSVLHPIALADSSQVKVGDGVVAIGSPFGLENTVTAGIVSALHREITAPNNFTITNTIQTDAAINHGNSGGVLLDLHGDVVGVTAQIKSDSGDNAGIGFAIPSNTVRTVAGQLIGSGTVEHAYLGVRIQTIPSDVAAQLGTSAGVEVREAVANGPAARAGIKGATATKVVSGQEYATGGDVIVRFDGRKVTSSDELQNAVDAKKPGSQATVTVVRNGQQRTIQVTLGKRPS